MKTNIKILSLGLKKSYWRKIKPLIKQALASQKFRFSHVLQVCKQGCLNDDEFELCKKYQPDFIFTSIETFGGKEEFEEFFKRYRRKNSIRLPTIFLFEKKLQAGLKELWDNNSKQCCILAGFGKISLPGIEALLEEVEPGSVIAIDPNPELSFNLDSLSIFAHDSQRRFIPFSQIDKIIWKKQEYNPHDFVRQQNISHPNHQFIGIWIENNIFSLVTGFPLQNIISLELGEIEINHIITWKQLTAKRSAYQAIILKLQQMSLEIIANNCSQDIVFVPEQIRNSAQLKIYSELGLTGRCLKQLLVDQGYQRIDLVKRPQPNPNYLLLNLSAQSLGESNTTLHFHLEKEIKTLSDSPGWDEELLLLPRPENYKEETADIEHQYKKSLSELEKIDQQLQIISNTKDLNQQKKENDQLLFNQVTLLKRLIGMAEIWENEGTILKRVYGESAFIFYDDKLQLPPIMLQLKRIEKRYRFNVSKIDDLKSLLQLDADIMTPFLDEGILVCCLSSKKQLSSQLREFERLLEKRRYATFNEEEKNLHRQRQKRQETVNKLISMKIWKIVESGFSDKSHAIYQAALRLTQKRLNEAYSKSRIKTICLASKNSLEVRELFMTVLKLFPQGGISKVYDVTTNLNLRFETTKESHKYKITESEKTKCEQDTNKQKLLDYNIGVVKLFQRNLLKTLIAQDTDLLLWIGDISLLYQLLSYIKQKTGCFLSVPVIGIIDGKFSPEMYRKIVESGARLLYWSQFNKHNPEYISQQLESLLSN